MSQREEVSPELLPIRLDEGGVEVEYADGRTVFYHGVPAAVEGRVRCSPGKQVHVLVTAPDDHEGVLVYVNDRTTDADILRSTGVGRVLLETGERTDVFPGVSVRAKAYRIEVAADPETARGRVFVFAEDEMGEQSYEIVAAPDDEGSTDTDGDAEPDA
jgi:hypothetical protein